MKEYRTFECVYILDTGVSYKEEISVGSTVLIPESFDYINLKPGYTFVGWRTDTEPSSEIITEKYMGTESITLYAVYRSAIILSYNGNGSTDGSIPSQTGFLYYNNGNTVNPTFVLANNQFTRTNFKFAGKYTMGSVGGTIYNVGASITLSSNTTFYAVWSVTYQSGSVSISHDDTTTYYYFTVTFPIEFESVPTCTINTNDGDLAAGITNVTTKNFTFRVSNSSHKGQYATGTWTASI